MKKLDKLLVNPERLMKNEELILLRGGTNCFCLDCQGAITLTGSAHDYPECRAMCYWVPWTCDSMFLPGGGY